LTDQAHQGVTRTASGNADDDADRLRWIGLRMRGLWQHRQHGSASRQTKQSSPGNWRNAPKLLEDWHKAGVLG